MKLWYSPRTRAFTALWMLEETGLPYALERVDIRAPDHPSAALRAINPMGKLPALEDGPNKLGETAALLLYVAEKAGPAKKLAPAIDSPHRGRFLQWLMFAPAVVEPAMVERMNKTPENTQQSGWGDYKRMEKALMDAMTPGQWLLGDTFTAADLYIASMLRFGMQFGMIDKQKPFEDFVNRASARPAFASASAIEEKEGA